MTAIPYTDSEHNGKASSPSIGLQNKTSRRQNADRVFLMPERRMLLARHSILSVIGALSLSSCGVDSRAGADRISASVARDTIAADTSTDSTAYLPLLDGRLALRELPDLLAVDVGGTAVPDDIVRRVREGTSRSVAASTRVESTWRTIQVFRLSGISDTSRRSPARLIAADSSLDFAAPVFVVNGVRRDTLYFQNKLVVEFKGVGTLADAQRLERSYGVRLLKQPSRDSGLTNFEFKYPIGTRLPLRTIQAIAADRGVQMVAPSYFSTGTRLDGPNDTFYAAQFNLNNSATYFGLPVDVRAEFAWTINSGDAVKIAVIDDGAWAFHPDLYGRVDPTGVNLVNDGVSATNPPLPFAHGTAVAGMIVATRNNAIGVAGLASNAILYPIKVFQAVGGGTAAANTDVANGINFARTIYNADVINASWSTTPDASIQAALNNARTLGRGGKGIVFVASVGNESASSINFPSNYTDVVAVGAITSSGPLASYSNRGAGISVVAPSSAVANTQVYCNISDAPATTSISGMGCSGIGLSTGYVRFGGTSAAAPQVAAVAAMIIARYPTLTSTQVRDRIRTNADSWGAANDVGFGKLNAYLSLVGRLTVAISGSTLVQPGVVTRTCNAGNGEDPKSYRWYLSYTTDPAGLFDTGVTTVSFSQSINSGESFLTRCVVTSGFQTVYAQKSMIAQ